jgi:hypothetical protein
MEGISEVRGKRKKTRLPRGAAWRSIHSHPHSHPFEVRCKAVQLILEESFPVGQVARYVSTKRGFDARATRGKYPET